MNEEKPTFKITDRRLFNTDGSPREDVQRDEESARVEHRPSGTQPTTSAAAESAHDAAPPSREQDTTIAASAPREDAANRTRDAEESVPVGDDPTNFINLVMFIASPAAAALGLTEHPGLGASEVDLELAKHCIDLLGALQQKTRGNLSLEERQTLDGLLAELRMQYLSLAGGVSAAPAMGGVGGRRRGGGGGSTGGGFTGSDITGGR